jgi:hypothetical protein
MSNFFTTLSGMGEPAARDAGGKKNLKNGLSGMLKPSLAVV